MECAVHAQAACPQSGVALDARTLRAQLTDTHQSDDRGTTLLPTRRRRTVVVVVVVVVAGCLAVVVADAAQRLVALQTSAEQHITSV